MVCVVLLFAVTTQAQLQLTPSGGNQKSVVTQYMGGHAHVTIIYNSPDVTSPQGQSRRGQIWGTLVPYGMNNLNFGISKRRRQAYALLKGTTTPGWPTATERHLRMPLFCCPLFNEASFNQQHREKRARLRLSKGILPHDESLVA